MRLSTVDLPQPLGPTSARNSRGMTVRSVAPSACTSEPRVVKRLPAPRSSTRGAGPSEGVEGSPTAPTRCVGSSLRMSPSQQKVLASYRRFGHQHAQEHEDEENGVHA